MPSKQIRAAVVGATTVLAKELLEELNSSPAAAWDLRLLDDSGSDEAQLSAAGEEAVLIQPLTREALEGMDFIFFAGDQATAHRMIGAARAMGAAVVDLTGALEGEEHFLVRSPWLGTGQRPDLTTVGITVPHPAAVMLSLVAQRLEKEHGLALLAATILEPASQAGSTALDELHQQTVGLLSFQTVPKEVFGTQVAFNLQATLGEGAKFDLNAVTHTVRTHLTALLGAELASRVHFQVLQAPVFHGYTASAMVQLRQAAPAANLRQTLHGGLLEASEETIPSNTAIVDSGDILISVRPETVPADETMSWLWMAADNVRLHARGAVAAALELGSMRPVTAMQ